MLKTCRATKYLLVALALFGCSGGGGGDTGGNTRQDAMSTGGSAGRDARDTDASGSGAGGSFGLDAPVADGNGGSSPIGGAGGTLDASGNGGAGGTASKDAVGVKDVATDSDVAVSPVDSNGDTTSGGLDGRLGTIDGGSDSGIDAGPKVPCVMLTYTANDEPAVTPPLAIVYPAFGSASVSGQGSNTAHVGYTVSLAHVDGGAGVSFGVYDSDTGEGVPWDDDAGLLVDGTLKAWGIDVGTSDFSTHDVTFAFDAPVTGFKFAITDFDTAGEAVSVRAFSVPTGGTAIRLTDHLLSDPTALPELARGLAHTGNDAYVVDQTRVSVIDGGGVYRYSLATTSATSNQNGTVLFVFDDAQPIQRVEVTFTGKGSGVWFTGMTYANMCGP